MFAWEDIHKLLKDTHVLPLQNAFIQQLVFKLIRLCHGCLSPLSEVPFTRSGDRGSHEMYNSKVYISRQNTVHIYEM